MHFLCEVIMELVTIFLSLSALIVIRAELSRLRETKGVNHAALFISIKGDKIGRGWRREKRELR